MATDIDGNVCSCGVSTDHVYIRLVGDSTFISHNFVTSRLIGAVCGIACYMVILFSFAQVLLDKFSNSEEYSFSRICFWTKLVFLFPIFWLLGLLCGRYIYLLLYTSYLDRCCGQSHVVNSLFNDNVYSTTFDRDGCFVVNSRRNISWKDNISCNWRPSFGNQPNKKVSFTIGNEDSPLFGRGCSNRHNRGNRPTNRDREQRTVVGQDSDLFNPDNTVPRGFNRYSNNRSDRVTNKGREPRVAVGQGNNFFTVVCDVANQALNKDHNNRGKRSAGGREPRAVVGQDSDLFAPVDTVERALERSRESRAIGGREPRAVVGQDSDLFARDENKGLSQSRKRNRKDNSTIGDRAEGGEDRDLFMWD